MINKLNIGVLFGGRSAEHAVSLMSAQFVVSALDAAKHNVTQIGISRSGVWMAGDDVLQALMAEDISKLMPVTMLPDPTRPGLLQIESNEDGELLKEFSELDVVFPVLHGTFGEDGTMQGLFELAGSAYVGAGVTGSAVGMDKAIFKDVMRANDIPTVETVLVLRSELNENMDDAIAKAEQVGDYPLFIKPANLGSSVGINKANSRSELVKTLMEAAQYDRRVVVQKGLNMREIEVGVLGNDRPAVSVCGEIIPGAEFYSYEAKYHDAGSKSVIPADIPQDVSERIQELAVKAYKVCDVAGLARVDFFLETGTNKIYLNELNTMPGFTEISMYPRLWEASGLPKAALVERLIDLALERKTDRDEITYQYERSN